MKRLTLEKVKERLKEKGFELLEKDYKNVSTKSLVKCFCGVQFETKVGNIICGDVESCGCGRKKDINIYLQRFKKSEIEPLEDYYGRFKKIKFKCFCGKIFKTMPHGIFTGATTSCGCNRFANKNHRWKGYKDISGSYFCMIKRNAGYRNLIFDLNIEYLWDLFLQQNRKCKISGVDLVFTKSYKHSESRKLQTASLDRIDSNIGYINGNVQWVHKRINDMKKNDSDEDFLNWVEIIYKFRKE